MKETSLSDKVYNYDKCLRVRDVKESVKRLKKVISNWKQQGLFKGGVFFSILDDEVNQIFGEKLI